MFLQGSRSFLANSSNGLVNPVVSCNSQQQSLNNNLVFENGGLLSKRFSSPSTSLGPLGVGAGLSGSVNSGGHCSDLSSAAPGSGLNPYEKWSNGSDKLFDQHTSDSILELSSKLLTLGKLEKRI